LEVDRHVPDDLKSKFAEMPPVCKNTGDDKYMCFILNDICSTC
jgi:hypothetical protein